MHVVFLCNEYPPVPHGGIGTFTHMMSHALQRRGHRVSVVGVYRDQTETIYEDNDGVTVIRVAAGRVPNTGIVINSRRLHQTLRQLDSVQPIDILDGWENSFAFLGRPTRARHVLRMQGGHHFFYSQLGKRPRWVRSLIERRSFANADVFAAVGPFVARTTRELLDMRMEQPITVLPNPVDVNAFHPMPEVAVEDGLLLFVGTITEKKGVRQLIAAMPEVLAAAPHARLVLIGRDTLDPVTGGSYIDALKATIAPGMAARIVFTGGVPHDELPRWMARAQVCVFPSHMETQGIVLLEAMASAKPVVGPTTEPGREVIEAEVSGLLCDPHRPNSIAAALKRVLLDAPLRERLGRAGRERVEALYSLEAITARNEAFYLDVLNGVGYKSIASQIVNTSPG